MRLQTLQSQRGIPSQTGLQGPDPRAAGLVGGAVADLGETAVRLTTALQDRRTQLQQATDLLQAQTALQTAADGLLRDVATDPDYRTMEARYPERFDQAAERVLGGLDDPRVKLAAKQSAAGLRHSLAGTVRSRAVTLQTEDAKATVEVQLDRLEQEAAGADDQGLQAAATRAFGAIDALVAGGAIGRDDAVKRKFQFRDDVIQAKAQQAILADPDAALTAFQDPKSLFGEADPVKREGWIKAAMTAQDVRLRRLDKAERDLERARAAESGAIRDRFTDLALQGALSAEALEAVGPTGTRELFGEDYRAVRGLLQRQFEAGGVDDPRVSLALERGIRERRVTSPLEITSRLGLGLSGKRVNELLTLLDQGQEEVTQTPAFQFWQRRVREAFTRTGPLAAVFPEEEIAKRDLVERTFWRRVASGENPEAVGPELIDRYSGLPSVALPGVLEPRFPTVPDSTQAFDRGLLTKPEYLEDLRRHKAREDAAAAAPAPPAKKPGLFQRFFGGER